MTDAQKELLVKVRRAHSAREKAGDAYARAVFLAREGGLSFGKIGEATGSGKGAAFKLYHRYRERQN